MSIQIYIFIFCASFLRAQNNNIDTCAEEDFSQYFGRNEEAFGRFILHVDLRDVVDHHGANFPESQIMLEKITDKKSTFVPERVNYSSKGPSKYRQNNEVYGIEITECPMILEDSIEFNLQMFYRQKSIFYRKLFVVTFDRTTSQITDILMYKEEQWTNRNIQMELSLIERKVIVMSPNGKVLKTYPVAVGGFNDKATSKKVSLLTPFYEGAYLNLSVSTRVRTHPSYFRERPFLRVSHKDSVWSGIGFHVRRNLGLKRGFETNGCMHMREKDIYELYRLLRNTEDGTISLSIHYFSEMPWDHPYPLVEDSYMRISRPPKKNKFGNFFMRKVYSPPPFEKLLDK